MLVCLSNRFLCRHSVPRAAAAAASTAAALNSR
jgi:hypothetical protein